MSERDRHLAGVEDRNDWKTTRPPEAQGRRGLWKGHKNAQGFKPGHDPRRHMDGPFRGEVRKSIEAACQAHTDRAVGFLVDTMDDVDAPLQARIQAATQLIDRGHGKAVDRVAIAQVDESRNAGKSLTLDEIRARLTAKLESEQETYQTLEHDGAIPDAS